MRSTSRQLRLIGAEARTRTGTPKGHHPLKMACLPIPPLRLWSDDSKRCLYQASRRFQANVALAGTSTATSHPCPLVHYKFGQHSKAKTGAAALRLRSMRATRPMQQHLTTPRRSQSRQSPGLVLPHPGSAALPSLRAIRWLRRYRLHGNTCPLPCNDLDCEARQVLVGVGLSIPIGRRRSRHVRRSGRGRILGARRGRNARVGTLGARGGGNIR